MRCQRWKVMKIKTQLHKNKQTASEEKCKIPPPVKWRSEGGKDGSERGDFSWKLQIRPRQWRDARPDCPLSQIRSAETWNRSEGNRELSLTKLPSAQVSLLSLSSVFSLYFTRRTGLLWWIQESFCEQQKTYWGIRTGEQWGASGDSGELGGEESQEDEATTKTFSRSKSIKQLEGVSPALLYFLLSFYLCYNSSIPPDQIRPRSWLRCPAWWTERPR